VDDIDLGSAANLFVGEAMRDCDAGEAAIPRLSATDINRSIRAVADLNVGVGASLQPPRLLPGDVVGRARAGWAWAVVPAAYGDAFADDTVVVVRLRGDPGFGPDFLAAYLRTSGPAEVLAPSVADDATFVVDLELLRNLRIPVPSLSRDHVAQLLADVDDGLSAASDVGTRLDAVLASALSAPTTFELSAELRKARDLASLVSQSMRRTEDPLRQVMGLFPYPVARAARRYAQAGTSIEQHAALLRSAESLIVCLGTMALAWCRTDDSGRAVLQAWVGQLARGGVSLGHWLAAARDVHPPIRSGYAPIHLLVEAMRPRRDSLLTDLDRLVQARNESAHGGILTEAEADDRNQELGPVLLSALARASFMVRSEWVLVRGARWRPRTSDYAVLGLDVMGDHPDFERVDFVSPGPLADRSLYVLSADASPLRLGPFAVPIDCPVCRDREIFYVSNKRGPRSVLLSFDRGHRATDDEVSREFELLLQGLAVDAAAGTDQPVDEVIAPDP